VETSGGDNGNVQTHTHGGGGVLTGLHNKSTGCSASGACAPGPEEEEKKKKDTCVVTPLNFTATVAGSQRCCTHRTSVFVKHKFFRHMDKRLVGSRLLHVHDTQLTN
jgi:hypothetical protein